LTKFSNAVYAWMQKNKKHDVTTNELWDGLSKSNPDLTTPSEQRKTPRTTCMRDLRKDERFKVGDRRVALK
jgi:hypothetical protein